MSDRQKYVDTESELSAGFSDVDANCRKTCGWKCGGTVVSSRDGTPLSRDQSEQTNGIRYDQVRNQCLCFTNHTVYSDTAVKPLFCVD